ncbi:MAG: PilN domain-containing protein [Planctomycetaceae bacterium]|nr:PilN domain-containing protein [Planctomycetales bacterium]MCB9926063.1 PilN domain-containing protein [Planctomycetaceae bacterium]
MTRKKNSKRKLPNIKVAIEVQRSKLTLVVAKQNGDKLGEIRGHHVAWLQEAESLRSEDGVRELTAALTMLVAKEKLAGAIAYVALGSELCVTRVAAGENESLRAEMRNLRDRSNQYLLLGAGEKATAESTRAIDAKHSQTWLTVANKGTLDNVVTAIQDAGLVVELVEHSLVAMCRAVGRTGRDRDRPVIAIDINERGVDLGVSYRGQLLFDYRPGGIDSKERIGEIVSRHLDRIQRYCARQFRYATGNISEVLLCGNPEDLPQVARQFAGSNLSAEIFDPKTVSPDSEYAASFTLNGHYVAPLGSLVIEQEQLDRPSSERGLPDLMDTYRSRLKEPLAPALLKAAWPIAAMLLIAVGIQGAASLEKGKAVASEEALAVLAADQESVERMRLESEVSAAQIKCVETIIAGVEKPTYHKLIAAIGQSAPNGVWLESLRVDDEGRVSIQGPGRTDDMVFGFVEQLKKLPMLSDVTLQGQQPVQLQQGPAIRFDIKCKYVESNDIIERTASND